MDGYDLIPDVKLVNELGTVFVIKGITLAPNMFGEDAEVYDIATLDGSVRFETSLADMIADGMTLWTPIVYTEA